MGPDLSKYKHTRKGRFSLEILHAIYLFKVSTPTNTNILTK